MRYQQWRTLLFVPGNRPDRIAKAGTRGADAVVVDLEDAVPAAEKEHARELATEQLGRGLPGVTLVRVNGVDSGELEADVRALAGVLDRVAGVLLPKADGPAAVVAVESLLDRVAGTVPALLPIIETPVGVFEARATATASPRVETLLFGPVDLAAELAVEPSVEGVEFAYSRSQVVLAAAAAGLAAPLDGPHTILGDVDGLARSTRLSRSVGFGGRVVLHPDQIPVVHEAFGPVEAQLDWAERVVAVAEEAERRGAGVARLPDGTFVDEPVVKRARAIMRSAVAR
ncbi:MAG: citrate lyase subunit beta / citryl-CoA lyase [Streptomyces sp.]|nr:citrate lyase subunit beta / citryl-CoA lyase [Streptomyces sp.]